jgi:hypothetical protein
MDAMELAGWEGIWGGLLCVFVFLPLFQTIPGMSISDVFTTGNTFQCAIGGEKPSIRLL